MSQKRRPPAYMEYAASMIAALDFRLMTLQERGLLYSMRLEFWENGSIPEDPSILAKLLGFSEHEIVNSLPAVKKFFVADADGNLFSQELKNYKELLYERRERQSAGGKAGAETVWKRKKKKIVINLPNDE